MIRIRHRENWVASSAFNRAAEPQCQKEHRKPDFRNGGLQKPGIREVYQTIAYIWHCNPNPSVWRSEATHGFLGIEVLNLSRWMSTARFGERRGCWLGAWTGGDAIHGLQYIYTLAISRNNNYLAAGGGSMGVLVGYPNSNPSYDLRVFLLKGDSVEVYKMLKGHTSYIVRL